ncbi:MAG: Gfo/Idh/MocA family oxidoreductase [Bryobacteraceae bacterium]|nr:Gfo/Idh/MocA family oxidoreductase [Bryobacteraceae bacterium]
MNRRYFFGAAVTAGLAAQTRTPASDTVRIGMIGLGGRGRALTNAVVKLPGARIVHLCDVDQANLERAAKLVTDSGSPAPGQSADMRRVLDDKNVDAVYIATPDHWHAPATILACDAGKDVYVEKPASHNLREGRLMIDAARRNNRIVQLGTQSRSRPSTIRAIEYVRSGKIGNVLMAKAWNIQLRKNIGHKDDGPVPAGVDYETWLGPTPWIPFNENRFHYNWHWHWHFGTGDIGNDGAHQIDIARWALGVTYPVAASGMGRKLFFDDDQQTPDTMNITFDYGGKALLWEMRIWTPYPLEDIDNGVAVYGTQGQVHIGRWNNRWGFKVFDADGKMIHHDNPAPGTDGDEHHQRNFADCVRSRKLPNADIGIGHLSCLPCHLGNIVARTGRNLRFDAGSETVLADSEANHYVARRYRTHWSTPKIL